MAGGPTEKLPSLARCLADGRWPVSGRVKCNDFIPAACDLGIFEESHLPNFRLTKQKTLEVGEVEEQQY